CRVACTSRMIVLPKPSRMALMCFMSLGARRVHPVAFAGKIEQEQPPIFPGRLAQADESAEQLETRAGFIALGTEDRTEEMKLAFVIRAPPGDGAPEKRMPHVRRRTLIVAVKREQRLVDHAHFFV